MRNFFAVIGSIIVASLVFMLFEQLNLLNHPLPKDVDVNDMDAIAAFTTSLPISALAMIAIGWFTGSFFAGITLALITTSKSILLPLISGGLLTIGGIINVMLIHHPLWLAIIGVGVYIPVVYFGWNFLLQRRAAM